MADGKRFDLLAQVLGITSVELRDNGEVEFKMVEQYKGEWVGNAVALDISDTDKAREVLMTEFPRMYQRAIRARKRIDDRLAVNQE